MCQDKKAVPWADKKSQAYFLGALSGGGQGEEVYIDRMKLIWMASENMDLIDFQISQIYNIDRKHIPPIYLKEKYTWNTDCLPQTYKYMLTLDGWVSAWERGP